MPGKTEINLPSEVSGHCHDVDGIVFLSRGSDIIVGAGWQGGALRFSIGSLPLMYQALDLLATLPDSASQIVETEIGDSTLFIEQSGNWVQGETKDNTLAFSLAIPDRNHIRHVVEELQHLLRGEDELSNHFCSEFGVIDDD